MGSGADAAPYFRVFSSIIQSKEFDPFGKYVRAYVPELAKLPDEEIHKPKEARPAVLAAAAVKLGKTYPGPVVDHMKGREWALAAFEQMKD